MEKITEDNFYDCLEKKILDMLVEELSSKTK